MEFGEEESFDKPAFLPSTTIDDDEYEYEYEDESEEDEGTAFALRHRPVFIPKVGLPCLPHPQTNRKTVLDPEEEELKELERQQKEEEKKLKRVEEVSLPSLPHS